MTFSWLIFHFLLNKKQDKLLTVADVEAQNISGKIPAGTDHSVRKSSPDLESRNILTKNESGNRKLIKNNLVRSISNFSIEDFHQVSLPALAFQNLSHLSLLQNIRVSFKRSDKASIFVSGGYYFYEEASTELSTVIWDKSKNRLAYFSGEIVIEVKQDIRDIVEALGVDIISEPFKNKYIVSVKMLDNEAFYDFLLKLDKIESIKKLSLDLSFARDQRQ